MSDPFVLLGLGVMGVVVFWRLFCPVKGYVWRWQQTFLNTERVLIEDSLKHLHECEYHQIPCTLKSLSGALSISNDQTARLIERLEGLTLVKTTSKKLCLTEEGRSYALRVIRIHRLWERYLAEKTGVPEQEWHLKAEQREHRMSIQEANMLAQQMGNPHFDPHGDPIPTVTGELPPPKGIPLNDLLEGAFARIIHVEDEPEAIYVQLVAEGLYPGMNVQMLNVSPERIRFAAEGEELSLAPIFAANLTVAPLEQEIPQKSDCQTLAALVPGEKARVIRISKACRWLQRRRLMDLGIIPETTITAEIRSFSGNPTAYRIRGALIALRKEQAEMVYIKKTEEKIHGT